MPDFLEALVDGVLITDVIQAIVVSIGVIFAAATYRRNSKLQRAEWLYRLYQQFFENPQFKPIRRLLDYPNEDDLALLKSDIDAERGSAIHESLVDYLNFFEFIFIQMKGGNLKRSEIYDMFEYYIRRLKDHGFIVDYVETYGYEYLEAEFAKITGTK